MSIRPVAFAEQICMFCKSNRFLNKIDYPFDFRLCSAEWPVRLQLDSAHGSGKATGFLIGCAFVAHIQISHHIGISAACGIYYLQGGIGGYFIELSFGIYQRTFVSQCQQYFFYSPICNEQCGLVGILASGKDFHFGFVAFNIWIYFKASFFSDQSTGSTFSLSTLRRKP